MNGWYPDRDPAYGPSPNYEAGRAGKAIRAVCIHIAEGGYKGSIQWLSNPASQASSHFVISLDGRIAQLVSIYDTAWTNGATYRVQKPKKWTDELWKGIGWYSPDDQFMRPSWPHMAVDRSNPNYATVSIEHQGFTGKPWPDAMREANARLLQWLRQQPGMPTIYVVGDTLIGHNMINPASRAYCPGSAADLDRIAIAGNAGPAAPPAPPPSAPDDDVAGTYIVTAHPSARVRVAPRTNSGIVKTIPKGEPVAVIAAVTGVAPAGESSPIWYQVSGGYLYSKLAKPRPDPAPAPPAEPPPPSGRRYTDTSPLLLPPGAVQDPRDQERCVRYILARKHGEYTEADVRKILAGYAGVCSQAGLDLLLVVAQLIHETTEGWRNGQPDPDAPERGPLCSWWSQRGSEDAPRRNPAGIGVTGQWVPAVVDGREVPRPTKTSRGLPIPPGAIGWARKDNRWYEGNGFRAWVGDADVKHAGRLLALCLEDADATEVQRRLIAQALAPRALDADLRGSVTELRHLGSAHNPRGRSWAQPGTNYGEMLADIANILTEIPV